MGWSRVTSKFDSFDCRKTDFIFEYIYVFGYSTYLFPVLK